MVVNDVQLEVDDNGYMLCVSGLCAPAAWQETLVVPPPASRRIVRVEAGAWVPGVSKRLTKAHEWPVFVNYRVGSVCIGNVDARSEAFEFASGCVAVISGEALLALWLTPRELPYQPRGRTHTS